MYIIKTTNQKEASYMKAIQIANEIGSKVVDENTGMVKWEPTPEITAKAMRRYNERVSAHNAYKQITGRN